MKKLALICLSPLVLTTIAMAGGQNAPAYSHPKTQPHQPVYHPFTGFNITGAMGGVIGQGDVKQNFLGNTSAECTSGDCTLKFSTKDTLSANDSLELFESNVAGLAAIEASYQFNNGLVLAFAGTAGFNNLDMHNNLSLVDNSAAYDANTGHDFFNLNDISSAISIELSNDFAFLFKPGFVVRKNTLFYALVGPRWGNFHTQLDTTFSVTGEGPCLSPLNGGLLCEYYWESTANNVESHSEYELGVTAGVGLRQVVSKHFLIGLEYAYTHYGDLDSLQTVAHKPGADECFTLFSPPAPACATIETDFSGAAKDLIVDTHTLMGTVSYRF